MNKISAITAFLGAVRNRYIDYQPDRTLHDKLKCVAQIKGLDGVELCYPADFADVKLLKSLLTDYGLGVSAVNFRSRRNDRWWRGSFSSEDPSERAELVDDMKRAMDLAAELGCHRISTCPLNDGHDYVFEMDYMKAYGYAEETFAEICQYNRDIRICIEYKWSDPRARCLLGSAGESLSFCQSVGAPNLGVTLDFGHSRYVGERPAQAACLLARVGKLFYVHLNDNDGLWDWDMIPGAYHLWEFVEFFYFLEKIGYNNDWYACDVLAKEISTFSTFEVTVAAIRKMEQIAERLHKPTIEELLHRRDPTQTIQYLLSVL